MTLEQVKTAIIDEANEIFFDYNGKRAGILISVEDGIFTYTLFHSNGDVELTLCCDFDEMVNVTFFDGKSFVDILDSIEIEFS